MSEDGLPSHESLVPSSARARTVPGDSYKHHLPRTVCEAWRVPVYATVNAPGRVFEKQTGIHKVGASREFPGGCP